MGKLRTLSALLAGAASLALAACGVLGKGQKPIPEIGKGLPQTAIEGHDAFDARVKSRFPAGSEVDPMVRTLQDQGFELSGPGNDKFKSLNYRNGGFPVHTLWSVRWRENDGRITEVWGVFGHTGP
ncbi:hypothetical protein [Altererythrobacter sp.]|uniref:hypothetical protein n=1 Tax=Altererythrobacter sp. TaxID=1872480 RepID=UPI003D0BE91F